MHFPVFLSIGPLRLHPHAVFETLAYAIAFRYYLWRRKGVPDALTKHQRGWVFAAAIAGAALGSKLLYLAVDPALTSRHLLDPAYILGGKTIVGGLGGGLLAVELMKRRLGVLRSTGDLYAIPLALGMMIGRVGCFLTGLSDRTFGTPTSLPWGVDFGDGIPRHPNQLYEIAFLLLLTAYLAWLSRRAHAEGAVFRHFMIGYMAFRLAVEFLKPDAAFIGLTAIQWACAAVLAHYALGFVRRVPQESGEVYG